MKIPGFHFYVVFFITVYPTALVSLFLFDVFLIGGKGPGIQFRIVPLLEMLFLGCLIHVVFVAESSHELVRKLAEESTRSRLLWAGFLSGLLEILVCFALLSAVTMALETLRNPGGLVVAVGLLLQLGAVTIPAMIIPLIVVHRFIRE